MKSKYDFVRFLSEDEFADWLLKELVVAYKKARKGKRATVDEHRFELNWAENLLRLREAILLCCYRPGRGIAFITTHPVIREIFAAPFKDRVMHHFLHDIIVEFWDSRLIYDAYSCRKGKGVVFGVKRFDHHVRQVSRGYQDTAYVIKMDIQGYFMSLPRKRLMDRVEWGLEQQFPEKGRLYETVRELWGAVIFDDPCDGVTIKGTPEDWAKLPRSKSLMCQPPGRGLVIGNLSSQLLSNIYLDPLDRFIVHDLGYNHYGRYVDDFYIVVTKDQLPQAKRDVSAIRAYLESLELTMHPNKTKILEVHQGVEWLGMMVRPWGISPGRRMMQFFRDAAYEFSIGQREIESITSYLGHMKWVNSKKFEKQLFDAMGWRYRYA